MLEDIVASRAVLPSAPDEDSAKPEEVEVMNLSHDR
jgi:hypothetical protein